MKTTWILGSTVALLAGIATTALAQSYGPDRPRYDFGHAFGGYDHASTYEEGVLRGYADLTRSQGESAYWHSLASINRQEAFAKYLRNREQNTETYFRTRAINRDARAATRPQRLTTEQYAALAKKQAPDRLNEQQYHRAFGRLNWPAVLMGEQFAAEREILNMAFAARASSDAGVSSVFSSRVREHTDSMQARLRSRMDSLNQMEYLAGRKFLAGLAIEAQKPFFVESVAAAK